MKHAVRTMYYLEMREKPDDYHNDLRYTAVKMAPESPEICKYMYTYVGASWRWKSRLVWNNNDWANHLSRRDIQFWILLATNNPVGYFELLRHPDNDVEITYLGLLPAYIGKGLGRHLLETAAEKAWHMSDHRIWLKTSTTDHPNALDNYLKRGFSIFETRQILPEESVSNG